MSTCDPPVYRAIVTSSSASTGQIFVRIPSLLGIDSTIELSKIGRSAHDGVWTVPAVNAQIVVTADDYNFTNAFWVQTDAVAGPTGATGPVWASTFTYKVGDTGPGGGIIFFVDRHDEYTGFTYLEVAPVGAEVIRRWAQTTYQSTSVTGADSFGLGTGLQNTLDIVAQGNSNAATCAAKYCDALTYGGKSDWYLPSFAELKMVYDVVHLNLNIGGFDANGYYWSSSENSASTAHNYYFSFGSQSNDSKSTELYVRPVRKF